MITGERQGGERQAGADVLAREPREVRRDLVLAHAGRQIGQNIADRDARSPGSWVSAARALDPVRSLLPQPPGSEPDVLSLLYADQLHLTLSLFGERTDQVVRKHRIPALEDLFEYVR